MSKLKDKLEKEKPASSKAKVTPSDKTPYSEGIGIDGSKNADEKVLNAAKLLKGRVYGDLGAGSKNSPGYGPGKGQTYSDKVQRN